LRSSGDSIGPHLLSSWLAALSTSLVASLIRARPMISLRVREAADTLPARNLDGLALISRSRPSDSGDAISTAPATALGRLASIASRARCQASLTLMRTGPCAPTICAAASVQASSPSRCANQVRLTSSASAGGAAGPSLTNCTSAA
jgi:hypothetical protein